MKKIALLILFSASVSFAGPVVLPQSSIAPNPAYTRQASLGTKGFKCWSTVGRDAMRCKTATAAGVGTVSKWFLNGDESKVYPTTEDTISTERGKVTSICQRAYSTATAISSHCWGQ